MKYRKTALIEAEQFDGSEKMIERYDLRYNREASLYEDREIGWVISTLEGDIEVHINDWIATGINGEHWAITDDIFKKTYEAVKDGCNYCQQDEALMQTESGALIIINNKLFEIVVWDDYNDRPSDKVNDLEINYCPMCGRKLGADEV